MNYQTGIKRDGYNYLYSNRGMALEDDLNNSNTYYRETDRAIIYKRTKTA